MAFKVKRELYCTMYRQLMRLPYSYLSGVAVAVYGKGTLQLAPHGHAIKIFKSESWEKTWSDVFVVNA